MTSPAPSGFKRRDAERLKCFYGSAMTSPRDNHEMIEARQIGSEEGAEPLRITRAQLMTVVRQRVEELTAKIEEALKSLGFTGPVGRQVVLTGGGAELKNIADYMQGVLGRSVRVGRPKTDHRPSRRAQRAGFLDAGRARHARVIAQRRHPRPRAWKDHGEEAGHRHVRTAVRRDERRGLATHQITRSLPPSTGTCAPVVLAKSGPHISAASSATSWLVTSALSTLFVL